MLLTIWNTVMMNKKFQVGKSASILLYHAISVFVREIQIRYKIIEICFMLGK
jgi:hypothetical protein